MDGDSFICLNCNGSRSVQFYHNCADLYLGKPVRVDYVRCEQCGLVQQSPVPEDVASFYEAYPVHESKSWLYDHARRLVMRQVYYDASALSPGHLLLDYGCGDGSYLESLKGNGLDLVGFEVDPAHAERLSQRLGIPVYCDVGALVSEYHSRVNVLAAHFVIEHVTNLDTAFAHISVLLAPGGIARIVVPNVSSWESRMFRTKWHGLDPPRHISFPDGRVVGAIASRHGMRLIEERAVAFPNGVAGSLATVLGGRFRYPLYLLFLPIDIVMSAVAPSGQMAYRLVKEGPSR
ncbi:MAG: class I SAM-dependent methyltransferase [Actinomycetota bacterium]|nr:class I SAM-dependent methyltransferase [Actinomycetota bacterium]